MSKNKSVQTGPKSQDGGLKDGFIRSVRYQFLTEVAVAKLPMIPAPSQTKIQRISLIKLIFVFFATINFNTKDKNP